MEQNTLVAHFHSSDFDFHLPLPFILGHYIVLHMHLVLICKDKPEYDVEKHNQVQI